jgi:hypothetical protein
MNNNKAIDRMSQLIREHNRAAITKRREVKTITAELEVELDSIGDDLTFAGFQDTDDNRMIVWAIKHEDDEEQQPYQAAFSKGF